MYTFSRNLQWRIVELLTIKLRVVIYQERPLKTLDWSNGIKLPFSVSVFELKLGFTVTMALFPPLVNEMKT